ncbi:MAG: hypothetical protein AB7T22_13805 [Calditrichaceae bacterium]
MKKSFVLLIDALINLILGLALMISYPVTAEFLGLPAAVQLFYPNILGAVLFGIGLALLIEYYHTAEGLSGLGLGGAVAVNLSGGFVLGLWLLFGELNIPLRGQIFLWILVFILIVISAVELWMHSVKKSS